MMEIAKALTTVLHYARATKPDVKSEQQFVHSVVEGFANTGAVPTFLHGVGRTVLDIPDVKALHQHFCEALQAVIDNRLSSIDRKRVFAKADRVLLVPRTDDGGTVMFVYLPESTESALAHALRLVMDASKPYKNDLKQCQWAGCKLWPDIPGTPEVRRFFFVSARRRAAAEKGKERTGKLPDRYCCEDHMLAAHRARATAATLKRRQELRERKVKLAAARSLAKRD